MCTSLEHYQSGMARILVSYLGCGGRKVGFWRWRLDVAFPALASIVALRGFGCHRAIICEGRGFVYQDSALLVGVQ